MSACASSCNHYAVCACYCIGGQNKICFSEVNHAVAPRARDFLHRQTAAADRDGRAGRDVGVAKGHRASCDLNIIEGEVRHRELACTAVNRAGKRGFGVAVADHVLFALSDRSRKRDGLPVQARVECNIVIRRGGNSVVKRTLAGRGAVHHDIACNVVFHRDNCQAVMETHGAVVHRVRDERVRKDYV